MELRHLKHFMMLAQQLNYQQAANALNIAQPSLTRSIQKLEASLGVTLFNRSHAGISLTQYGKLLVTRAEPILTGVSHLYHDILTLQGRLQGEIVIGASSIVANALIGQAIARLLVKQPQIQIELQIEDWSVLLSRLLAGHIGLFVAEIEDSLMQAHADLAILPLPATAAVFCCRPDHPIFSVPQTAKTLRHYPLAVPRQLSQHCLQQFGDLFSPQRYDFSGLLRYDQFEPIKSSIMQSDLIAITPKIAISGELACGTLRLICADDLPQIPAQFGLVMTKFAHATGLYQQLINEITLKGLLRIAA
ncbi:MAG: LysR family transcriptional regulator [Shewanella sp.]